MQQDPFNTFYSEIFQKSRCLMLEESLINFLQNNLHLMGYVPRDRSKKMWFKNNKTVVICLVDDISTCSDNNLTSFEWFDSNTVVITDNKIYSPTRYRVLQLPESFFGIYYYQPDNVNFSPEKLINLSVNRIDPLRQSILLELVSHNNINEIFKDLNINFNCFMHEKDSDVESLVNNFKSVGDINQNCQNKYFQELLQHIPINTHNLSVEDAILKSYVNLVIETYSGTDVVAISEKIFRSLVTPVPWTVYSGIHTVAFLKSLGFDVLDDLVDHSYDHYRTGNRIKNFTNATYLISKRLQQCDRQELIVRCNAAAKHNQKLLKNMRRAWPKDFAQWWADNVKYVE
jgi:hypothetical protein